MLVTKEEIRDLKKVVKKHLSISHQNTLDAVLKQRAKLIREAKTPATPKGENNE